MGRIVNRLVRSLSNLAFVSHGQIEDREEGLSRRSVLPVGLIGRFIPDLIQAGKVVIRLGIVRAVVACLAQQLGVHFHSVRRGDVAAHVEAACRRRIHAGEDGRPGRSTDGGIRPDVSIEHSPAGQSIQLRRLGEEIPIASEMRSVILCGDPQDIRSRRILPGEALHSTTNQTRDQYARLRELSRANTHEISFLLSFA
jgi:hypothetical protein